MNSLRPSKKSSGIFFDPVFGTCAPDLKWVPAIRYLLRRERVLFLTRRWSAGRLVEVGCGSGALLADFQRKGFQVIGVDSSPEARTLAVLLNRGLGSSVTIQPTLEIQKDFDYLVACEVLEHIEDSQAALKTWGDCLAPGGRMLISVPAHPRLWGPADEKVGHVRRYEREDLLLCVKSAGFEIEYIENYGFPLSSLTRRLREGVFKKTRKDESRARGELTARSGIDREIETLCFEFYRAGILKWMLLIAMKLQRLFLKRDWGDGLILIARKFSGARVR